MARVYHVVSESVVMVTAGEIHFTLLGKERLTINIQGAWFALEERQLTLKRQIDWVTYQKVPAQDWKRGDADDIFFLVKIGTGRQLSKI